MSADEVRRWRNQEPFQPFEIVTASGDRFPVYQPTAVLIMESSMLVGTDYESPDELPGSHEALKYERIATVQALKKVKSRRRR